MCPEPKSPKFECGLSTALDARDVERRLRGVRRGENWAPTLTAILI
jgi:hypothetical protein